MFNKKILDEPLPEKNLKKVSEAVLVKSAHKVGGKAFILRRKEKTWLRLENFKILGGPDLRVYLSMDIKAKKFIDLGKLKANSGNINYEIPNEAMLPQFPFILIWCRAFSVLFGYGKFKK